MMMPVAADNGENEEVGGGVWQAQYDQRRGCDDETTERTGPGQTETHGGGDEMRPGRTAETRSKEIRRQQRGARSIRIQQSTRRGQSNPPSRARNNLPWG